MNFKSLMRYLVSRFRRFIKERSFVISFTKRFLAMVGRFILLVGLAAGTLASGQAHNVSTGTRNAILQNYVHIFEVNGQNGHVLDAKRVNGYDGCARVWDPQKSDECLVFTDVLRHNGFQASVKSIPTQRNPTLRVRVNCTEFKGSDLSDRLLGVTSWNNLSRRVIDRSNEVSNSWDRLEYCLSVLNMLSKNYEPMSERPGNRTPKNIRFMIITLKNTVDDALKRIAQDNDAIDNTQWERTQNLVEGLKKYYPRSSNLQSVDDRVNQHFGRGVIRFNNETFFPLGVSIQAEDFSKDFVIVARSNDSRRLSAKSKYEVSFTIKKLHLTPQPLMFLPDPVTIEAASGDFRRFRVVPKCEVSFTSIPVTFTSGQRWRMNVRQDLVDLSRVCLENTEEKNGR